MSLAKQLDEIDTSVTPTITALGSLVGVALVLVTVTPALVAISRWSHWLGVALSVCLVGGAALSALEVVGAFKLRSDFEVVAAPSSFQYLIGIKIVELLMFACATAIFYLLAFK